IARTVLLPMDVQNEQLRFGFEGVARRGNFVYVAMQREWAGAGDGAGLVRIARYDLKADAWTFAHYPLDAVASPFGGWVGLSEIVHLGGPEFAVIERDNRAGSDAAVKRIYRFSVAGVDFAPQGQTLPVLSKSLMSDLLLDGAFDFTGGPVPEKLEGLTLTADGKLWICNDNDGVDDNSGETRLFSIEAAK
ncbi:MAG: esterase-like activity of phytase family protein, partial [Planctomycetota bacterium]